MEILDKIMIIVAIISISLILTIDIVIRNIEL